MRIHLWIGYAVIFAMDGSICLKSINVLIHVGNEEVWICPNCNCS